MVEKQDEKLACHTIPAPLRDVLRILKHLRCSDRRQKISAKHPSNANQPTAGCKKEGGRSRTDLAGPAHAADDAGFSRESGREVDVGPVHAPEPLLSNAVFYVRRTVSGGEDDRSIVMMMTVVVITGVAKAQLSGVGRPSGGTRRQKFRRSTKHVSLFLVLLERQVEFRILARRSTPCATGQHQR